ncbi:MAG: substrate-binding domain-containing protein [Anaerolineae bacterium]
MRKGLGATALLLALLVVGGCETSDLMPTPVEVLPSVTPQRLRLAYPDALEPLVRAWISAYQRTSPAVEIVALERADPLAWQALERGDVDMVMGSWRPTSVPTGTWRTPLVRDGLAVALNPQNGLPGLTIVQLRELFQGRVTDWEMWEGLPGTPVLITRGDTTGDARFFRRQVMGDLPVALTAVVAPNTEAVLQFVGERPLAVGYLSTARLDERVRAVPVEGIPPTQEVLESGVYPLTRDFQVVTLGEPQGAVRDFVQWLLSPQGQSIVATRGWVPLAGR